MRCTNVPQYKCALQHDNPCFLPPHLLEISHRLALLYADPHPGTSEANDINLAPSMHQWVINMSHMLNSTLPESLQTNYSSAIYVAVTHISIVHSILYYCLFPWFYLAQSLDKKMVQLNFLWDFILHHTWTLHKTITQSLKTKHISSAPYIREWWEWMRIIATVPWMRMM